MIKKEKEGARTYGNCEGGKCKDGKKKKKKGGGLIGET